MAYWYVFNTPCILPLHVLTLKHCQRSFERFDGLILPSKEAYEQEVIDHITQWQKGLSKEVYTLGPLIPIESDPTVDEKNENWYYRRPLETNEPCSVVYVSCTASIGSIYTG